MRVDSPTFGVACTGSVWQVQRRLHVWAGGTGGRLLPDHLWTLPGRASLTSPAASSAQPLHLYRRTTRLRLHLPAAGAPAAWQTVMSLPQGTGPQMRCTSRPSFALCSGLRCQACDSACKHNLAAVHCTTPGIPDLCLTGDCHCCRMALVSAARHLCSAPQPHLAASARPPAVAAPAQKQQPR